jgi:hypothetical protein
MQLGPGQREFVRDGLQAQLLRGAGGKRAGPADAAGAPMQSLFKWWVGGSSAGTVRKWGGTVCLRLCVLLLPPPT